VQEKRKKLAKKSSLKKKRRNEKSLTSEKNGKLGDKSIYNILINILFCKEKGGL